MLKEKPYKYRLNIAMECMRWFLRVGSLGVLIAMGGMPWAHSAEPQKGRALSVQCVACHGVQGLSLLPNAPHLAGQPAIYLEEQLKNYRSGRRAHEVMRIIAKPLSDQDIENLSAFYSSMILEVRAPQ